MTQDTAAYPMTMNPAVAITSQRVCLWKDGSSAAPYHPTTMAAMPSKATVTRRTDSTGDHGDRPWTRR
jgi:hypothetical protein